MAIDQLIHINRCIAVIIALSDCIQMYPGIVIQLNYEFTNHP